jgi:hypothetical protein
MSEKLSADDRKRAQTWNLEIAAIILGEVPFQDIGHDRRWEGLGGFSVDRRSVVLFCHG